MCNSEKYSIGDVINVEITAINDNGVFVKTQDGCIGRISTKDFFLYEYDRVIGSFSVGDKLDAKIISILPDGKLNLSRYKAIVDWLLKQIEPGHIVEAEVIKVDNQKAIIEITNTGVRTILTREELSPNKVLRAVDEVFVGEHIRVVYSGYEGGSMKFTRKYTKEDVYDKKLYDLSLEDILATMNLTTKRFIGKIVTINNNYYITNLISIEDENEENNGKLLIDPIEGRCINVLIDNELRNLVEEGEYYAVSIDLATQKRRCAEGTPYLFIVRSKNIQKKSDPYKESVELAFRRHDNPSSNTIIAHLLSEVGQNLYTSRKRMFFELLQNADDEASLGGVRIKLQISDKYFVLVHNGNAFNKYDFRAITSAAKSTKSLNSKKTGYKGIGFKSVFTNSEKVIIKSGGYIFSFDKSLPIYENFEGFYFGVKRIENDIEEQEDFLKRFEDEYRRFDRVNDIPWQLLPIWVDDDSTIGASNPIFRDDRENVAIALEMNTGNLNDYQEAIQEVFNEPRFMLFLRNTKRIQLVQKNKCLTIKKDVDDDIVRLENSFLTNRRLEEYRIFRVENDVNNNNFSISGICLRIQEKWNDALGESENYFVRTDNEGRVSPITSEIIPNRIASATITTISLAIRLNSDHHVEPILENDTSFYSYLPMNEHRFNFSFYINADFIPKSDREGVQSDNPWNHFLFFLIGKSIVSMVASFASEEEAKYLELLPTKLFDVSSQDTNALAESFNRGYKKALDEEAFILNDNGEKVKAIEIIIDESELSDYIGNDFYTLIVTEKRLPHPKIESSCLSEKIFDVEALNKYDAAKIISSNIERTNEWIKNTDEEKRTKFYEWITKDKETSSLLSGIVVSLRFREEWFSYDQVNESNEKIITTEKLHPIRDILTTLGFLCTDGILENHPLKDFFEKQDEKKIFEKIQQSDIKNLSFSDRLRLFNCSCHFEGIGEVTLKEWNVFHNQNGKLCPLDTMCKYSEDVPKWLHNYMIDVQESDESLNRYMVQSNAIYSYIVEEHIDDILLNTTIEDVFNAYKEEWRDAFTNKLIDEGTEGILSIVEQSSDDVKYHYIQSIPQINLLSENEYSSDSWEYRIIKMAATITRCSTHIRSIINIDGLPLKEMGTDEFIVKVNNINYPFRASQILSSCSDNYRLDSVISKFREIDGHTNIFQRERVYAKDVFDKLCVNYDNSPVPVSISCEQFCFLILYFKSQYPYIVFPYPMKKYKISINQCLFTEILDKCYSMGNIGGILNEAIESKYITFEFNIRGKYIDCEDYTLENERVPDFIKTWADDDEKKQFLKQLEVRDEQSNEIIRRKSFKENREENVWNITDTKIIYKFLDWVSTEFECPITTPHQVSILRSLFNTLQRKPDYYKEDFDRAIEWANDRYLVWKRNKNVKIFIVEGKLPCRGYYNNKHLFTDCFGEYTYLSDSNTIYISSTQEPKKLLMDVYSDRTLRCPLSEKDWNEIFLVSADILAEKEREINTLKEKLEELKNSHSGIEVDEPGRLVEGGPIPPDERERINREARIAAKKYLEQFEDYDCNDWDPEKSSNMIKDTIKFKDKYITVVVTSSRARKLYLHPWLFAELMEDADNLLLNYGSDNNIHTLSFDDIFKDNPKVNLIFDTDVTDPKTIAGLANQFMSSPKTYFVIENPNYSANDRIKSFGLNEKKEGNVRTDFNDDDIYGLFE